MVRIIKWKDILIKLLILDNNETYALSKVEYSKFQNLVIEVAKAEADIRFCSNESCKCHPEQSILEILNDFSIGNFLYSECPEMFEAIKKLCKNYIPYQNKLIDM